MESGRHLELRMIDSDLEASTQVIPAQQENPSFECVSLQSLLESSPSLSGVFEFGIDTRRRKMNVSTAQINLKYS